MCIQDILTLCCRVDMFTIALDNVAHVLKGIIGGALNLLVCNDVATVEVGIVDGYCVNDCHCLRSHKKHKLASHLLVLTFCTLATPVTMLHKSSGMSSGSHSALGPPIPAILT